MGEYETLEQQIQELWKRRGFADITEKFEPLENGKFRWIIEAGRPLMSEIKQCKSCGSLLYTSYLLFDRPTEKFCYNARSKICKKCEEPECNLAGKEFFQTQKKEKRGRR